MLPIAPSRRRLGAAVAVVCLLAVGCSSDDARFFATSAPGAELPGDEVCGPLVEAESLVETHPDNVEANRTVEGPPVDIDGADDQWNRALAPRISGAFTGTTEEILRWGACKWGFDENITRARAVTESSWRMSTAGDVTDDGELCSLIRLEAPCAQSHGLLQVKGTVHDGTYPATTRATAFGVDYAMAWLRACYEGSFVWLADQGYRAGDEWGCIGAWFSGEWYDDGAGDYIAEVRGHLIERTWETYAPAES